MAKLKARKLGEIKKAGSKVPAIGVFSASDPRIDKASRTRCRNIIETISNTILGQVVLPDKTPVDVVYSTVLIDGESQADIVAQQFREAGVDILVCVPDTWAFPQMTLISLLQQFPKDTPLNITCGNSAPKPGVVFAHAVTGAIAQYGRMVHLNVGTWPDTGINPRMTANTETALIDWCYAAVADVYLKGKRVMIFGHDSMGMETALAHILPTRNTFGIEIARLDMKFLADMLCKKAYNKKELVELRKWVDNHLGKRIELRNNADSERLNQSLAMYLINRDLMKDLNAVGGGFMSQLEWGSDNRGIPLPVADVMESLFNSTFDHNGPKAPIPCATEADVQGLLTMLYMTYLSGGNPPLFMDFRKVWEAWELKRLAKKLKVPMGNKEVWQKKGLVDGNNSGSASLDWAAKPGVSVKQILSKCSFPMAELYYFPGGGNSVTFTSPGGIEGIAARMSYNEISGLFSMVWDQASTAEIPQKMAAVICNSSNPTWPHTFVVPKYASMLEYKQFAPANHFHMTWNLAPARLQYWMDLANVLSITPWQARPKFIEGVDRPTPLIYLQNGGEEQTKLLRKRR